MKDVGEILINIKLFIISQFVRCVWSQLPTSSTIFNRIRNTIKSNYRFQNQLFITPFNRTRSNKGSTLLHFIFVHLLILFIHSITAASVSRQKATIERLYTWRDFCRTIYQRDSWVQPYMGSRTDPRTFPIKSHGWFIDL